MSKHNEKPKHEEKVERINLSAEEQKLLLDGFKSTIETMKKVKMGFGYSGQATPNHKMLSDAIEASEKILDEIK